MSTPIPAEELAAASIIPVLTIEEPAVAPELGDALARGGLSVIEVTLRTPAGLPAIAAMSADQRLTVGAGTVLDPDSVERAADAGARFVVSPGLQPDIVERTRARGLLPLPGIATPSEAQTALRYDVTTCKFFPAEVFGGVSMLRQLAGPFPMLRFVPSGGISLDNAKRYLNEPTVIAVCGSWMVPADAVRRRDWDGIARMCRDTVAALRPDASQASRSE